MRGAGNIVIDIGAASHPADEVALDTELVQRRHYGIAGQAEIVGQLPAGWKAVASTQFAVEGDGHQGRRTGEIREFANIQVEVIVPPAVADELLARLEREFFPRFAIVAYESDVRVLRSDKF